MLNKRTILRRIVAKATKERLPGETTASIHDRLAKQNGFASYAVLCELARLEGVKAKQHVEAFASHVCASLPNQLPGASISPLAQANGMSTLFLVSYNHVPTLLVKFCEESASDELGVFLDKKDRLVTSNLRLPLIGLCPGHRVHGNGRPLYVALIGFAILRSLSHGNSFPVLGRISTVNATASALSGFVPYAYLFASERAAEFLFWEHYTLIVKQHGKYRQGLMFVEMENEKGLCLNQNVVMTTDEDFDVMVIKHLLLAKIDWILAEGKPSEYIDLESAKRVKDKFIENVPGSELVNVSIGPLKRFPTKTVDNVFFIDESPMARSAKDNDGGVLNLPRSYLRNLTPEVKVMAMSVLAESLNLKMSDEFIVRRNQAAHFYRPLNRKKST